MTSASGAAIGFALVWTITAIPLVGSAWIAHDAADVLERTLVSYADDLMRASQAQLAAERMVAAGRGYLLTREPERLARAREAEGLLASSLESLGRGGVEPFEQDLLRVIQQSADEYRKLLNAAFETPSSSADRASLVDKLREDLAPARERLDDQLGTLVAHEQERQLAARARAADAASRAVRITLVLGALALALTALLARLFTRKLAETSRREQDQAERATRALAARDELLRIVAHDLRNPLAAIALRASSIAGSTTRDGEARSATAIESICRRMAVLIESLLDAAGIEAGRLTVRQESFPAADVVRAALDTFVPAAREKSILLETEVTPPDLTIWADRERLFQVLSNLIGNALKFTPEQGGVRLSVVQSAAVVRFEVHDTGVGIVDEDLEHVFDRYWKKEGTGTKGVGLGLYIVKGIVDAHGGRIWVRSSPGVGSSFCFELPRRPVRAVTAASPSDATDEHLVRLQLEQGHRILH